MGSGSDVYTLYFAIIELWLVKDFENVNIGNIGKSRLLYSDKAIFFWHVFMEHVSI